MESIERSACFTGHRPSKFPFDTDNRFVLRTFMSTVYLICMEAYLNDGVNTFYTGMQIGMDVWAGLEILSLREKYPDIRLICVSPYEDEIYGRHGKDRDDYQKLLDNCDEFIPLAKRAYSGCFQARNRYMVEHSGLVIAAMSEAKSGTGQTVNYARRLGRKVHVIDLDAFCREHGFDRL